MLSKHEMRFNFLMLKFLSILNVFPIEVNTKLGKIKLRKQRWRLLAWKFLLSVTTFQLGFMVGRLVQLLLDPGIFNLNHFSIHCLTIVALSLSVCWSVILFYLWPETTVQIFNELFAADETNRVPFRWRKYSLQEHLTIGLPGFICNTSIMLSVVYLMEPTKVHYFHSLFTFEADQIQWKYTTIIIEVILYPLAIGVYLVPNFIQLLVFQKVLTTCNSQLEQYRFSKLVTTDEIISSVRTCRKLHILIGLFNTAFAYVTFTYKLGCTSGAIISLYFTIKFYEGLPIDSLANLIIAIDALLGFCIIFGHAFEIPGKNEELKKTILGEAVKCNFKTIKESTRRELNSIPELGIKVGRNTFQRASTTQFVDFVLSYFMSTIRYGISRLLAFGYYDKVQMKAISALFDFPNLNLDSYERLGRRYNPPPPPQPATLSNIGCSYDSSAPRIASGRRLNGYVGCNPVNPSSTNNNSSKSSDWFPYGGGTNRNPQNFKSRFGSPVCPNSSSTSNNRNGGVSYNRFGYARPISTNGGSKRASKTAKVLRSSFFQTPKLSLGCHVRLGESGDPSVVYVTNDGDKNKSI